MVLGTKKKNWAPLTWVCCSWLKSWCQLCGVPLWHSGSSFRQTWLLAELTSSEFKGLRFQFSCWLSSGGCRQLHKVSCHVAHSIGPIVLQISSFYKSQSLLRLHLIRSNLPNILVSLPNKMQWTGPFSHRSEGWKFDIKVPAWYLSVLQMATFLPCPPMWPFLGACVWSVREQQLSRFVLIRPPVLQDQYHTLRTLLTFNYLLKALFPNIATLRLRALTYGCGRVHSSVCSIQLIFLLINSRSVDLEP